MTKIASTSDAPLEDLDIIANPNLLDSFEVEELKIFERSLREHLSQTRHKLRLVREAIVE